MVNAFVSAKRSLKLYEPIEQLFVLNNAINSLINDKKITNTHRKYSIIQQLKKLKEDVLSKI